MSGAVLLTGGAGKFGKAISTYLVSLDWEVVITCRDASEIGTENPAFNNIKDQIKILEVDLENNNAAEQIVSRLEYENIKISHLINNARSMKYLELNDLGEALSENFLNEFNLDVVIPYNLVLSFAKSSFHELCNVVNVGSMYGLVAPNPSLYDGNLIGSPVQYGVSKAALHHLTKELAVRLADQHVRVNCVAFGGVSGRVDKSFESKYAQLVPSKRMLLESEVGGPIEFLLSSRSSAINGHVMVADGGWSIM